MHTELAVERYEFSCPTNPPSPVAPSRKRCDPDAGGISGYAGRRPAADGARLLSHLAVAVVAAAVAAGATLGLYHPAGGRRR